jgi:LemA protein
MSKSLIFGAAVLGVIVLGLLIVSGTYNRLVGLDESVGESWSQVENAYQRRADLVPNLVETVKGAADFERGTLEAVTEARSKVGGVNFEGAPDSEQMAAFQANQDQLSGALSRLLVVVEQYPQLTATQGFRDLQGQLEGTENRIAVERRRYNEVAREYNTARRSFPTVVVAGLLGFDEQPYFESDAGADQAPAVDFGSDEG